MANSWLHFTKSRPTFCQNINYNYTPFASQRDAAEAAGNVEPGDHARGLRGLALRVVEVGRYRDDLPRGQLGPCGSEDSLGLKSSEGSAVVQIPGKACKG